MKRRIWIKILALLLSVLLFGVSGPGITGQASSGGENMAIASSAVNSTGSDDNSVPGEVLAFTKTLEQAEAIALAYRLELKTYAYGIAVFVSPNPELSVMHSQIMSVDEMPKLCLNRLYSAYEDNPDTPLRSSAYDQYDQIVEPSAIPDSFIQYHHEEMDNPRAWELSTGAGVIVAVIDTGIDINHVAFSGRISQKSYNSHTNQIGIESVSDTNGHGTHVCGIVGASLDVENGVYGTAPDVELMVIKGSRPSDDKFELASLLRAINYAVENEADIINLSLGTPYSTGSIDVELEVILSAVNKGVTVVCAAGNERDNHAAYPAAYPETIAVSALKQGGLFDASYSNYGPEIDISAPGTAILSTAMSGGHVSMNGTSMASPNITGVAALIKALNPEYSPAQIKDVLCETAKEAGKLGKDEYYGNGIVNSYAAVLGVDALYDVTYDFNDGIRSPITTKVAPGSKLIEPTQPEWGAHVFQGWYVYANGGVIFNFANTINENITLYARWSGQTGYNVSGMVMSYNPGNATTLKLFHNDVQKYIAVIPVAEGTGQHKQSFIITGVSPGTYSLEVSKNEHTKFTVRNIVVEDNDVDLTQDIRYAVQTIVLICGDINGDGEVNQADLNILWLTTNYNKTIGNGVDRRCDLNGDGEVNQMDLNILWAPVNYNKGAVIIE